MPASNLPAPKSVERFNRKLDKRGSCWLWTGSQNASGFGRVRINGKLRLAHEVAYEHATGEAVGTAAVRQSCGNRLCCNPAHLSLTDSATAIAAPSSQSKPFPDFPLTKHSTGQWCKRIHGKIFYYGKDWREALERYQHEQKFGRSTKPDDALTLQELANHFLTDRDSLVQTGELKKRTWNDYKTEALRLVDFFGREHPVQNLTPDHFRKYREHLAKGVSLRTLANRVRMARMVFVHGYNERLLKEPVQFGRRFAEPRQDKLQIEVNRRGELMFEAEEIHTLVEAARPQLKAMILLAVNSGIGNADIARLTFRDLDLKEGWLSAPRGKNGMLREAPLWAETVEAIEQYLKDRAEPADDTLTERVFLTIRGEGWDRDSKLNPITRTFKALLLDCDLHRKKGLGFYTLRRVFETIGGDSCDQVAVDYIMGHSRRDMASIYRQRVFKERLEKVVMHVHSWLFDGGQDDE